MNTLVEMMIKNDYQNELLDIYKKETGMEPVPEDGGHTFDFEAWFIAKCDEARNAGCMDAESALRRIKEIAECGGRYFIVVSEWNYPTESGRDFECDFNTFEEAKIHAKQLCTLERRNFAEATGCDPLLPSVVELGGCEHGGVRYVITPKNGLDEWWYSARVIPIVNGEGVA